MSKINEINTLSIVGSGFMGSAIGLRAATYGYNIRFYDVSSEVRDQVKIMVDELRAQKEITVDITIHDQISEALVDADLIIEAIPEKMELKKEIFSKIDEMAPPHAIIGTNSSSIPVSKLEDSVSVKRKDKLLNLHFYPLPTYPMADIQRSTQTSDSTLEIGKKFVESIEIVPLIVKKECFGFVFNRIWRAIKKDILKIWAMGNADFQDVDKGWKIFTENKPLEPFKLMDIIGLDVIYDVEMSYYKETGNPDDKPPQELLDKINKGELGVKTGKGFYDYNI